MPKHDFKVGDLVTTKFLVWGCDNIACIETHLTKNTVFEVFKLGYAIIYVVDVISTHETTFFPECLQHINQ